VPHSLLHSHTVCVAQNGILDSVRTTLALAKDDPVKEDKVWGLACLCRRWMPMPEHELPAADAVVCCSCGTPCGFWVGHHGAAGGPPCLGWNWLAVHSASRASLTRPLVPSLELELAMSGPNHHAACRPRPCLLPASSEAHERQCKTPLLQEHSPSSAAW
jgi:hypothetical protein